MIDGRYSEAAACINRGVNVEVAGQIFDALTNRAVEEFVPELAVAAE